MPPIKILLSGKIFCRSKFQTIMIQCYICKLQISMPLSHALSWTLYSTGKLFQRTAGYTVKPRPLVAPATHIRFDSKFLRAQNCLSSPGLSPGLPPLHRHSSPPFPGHSTGTVEQSYRGDKDKNSSYFCCSMCPPSRLCFCLNFKTAKLCKSARWKPLVWKVKFVVNAWAMLLHLNDVFKVEIYSFKKLIDLKQKNK